MRETGAAEAGAEGGIAGVTSQKGGTGSVKLQKGRESTLWVAKRSRGWRKGMLKLSSANPFIGVPRNSRMDICCAAGRAHRWR